MSNTLPTLTSYGATIGHALAMGGAATLTAALGCAVAFHLHSDAPLGEIKAALRSACGLPAKMKGDASDDFDNLATIGAKIRSNRAGFLRRALDERGPSDCEGVIDALASAIASDLRATVGPDAFDAFGGIKRKALTAWAEPNKVARPCSSDVERLLKMFDKMSGEDQEMVFGAIADAQAARNAAEREEASRVAKAFKASAADDANAPLTLRRPVAA